ncbi:variable surface protein [Plasmodium gonderi]|uniref:Variable surface protein n=1 Tax=Plasmodium gonderi TaxID=77519 RepID=A0A1Y1JNP6_PLAGO|nr:variable surface protein [Plasmodium gonderi]GAW84091.1 variable surface protein [Plasmodium gonderi]
MSTLEDFNFKELFPTCMNVYDELAKNKPRPYDSNLNEPYKNIRKKLNVETQDGKFISHCKELINYLYYIKDKQNSDVKKRCNYLNYMLKHVLKTSKCNDKNSKTFYDKIIGEREISYIMNSSNVCECFIQDLDNNIFSVLLELNGLYEIISKPGLKSYKNKYCYDMYKEISGIYDNSNNECLRRVVKNFKKENMAYFPESINELNFTLHIIMKESHKKNNALIYMIFFLHYLYTSYGSFL